MPCQHPILLPNAVPIVFTGLPSYLSAPVEPERRTNPAKRQKLINGRHEQAASDFMSKDIVSNFDDFVKEYRNFIHFSLLIFEVTHLSELLESV